MITTDHKWLNFILEVLIVLAVLAIIGKAFA